MSFNSSLKVKLENTLLKSIKSCMDTCLLYMSFYAVSSSSTIALHLVARDQEFIGTQFGTRLQD